MVVPWSMTYFATRFSAWMKALSSFVPLPPCIGKAPQAHVDDVEAAVGGVEHGNSADIRVGADPAASD
jgi:hypothetical protein